MIIAAAPANETERLEALASYEILDTEAEGAYDDITRLAAQICEAPIALITLIDSKRQWFKSKVGTEVTGTARDLSFCAHSILHDHVLQIEDTREDSRFSENPMVTSKPFVIFYAGAPLITPNGEALGTLCVMDHKPRRLRGDQIFALSALARQVSSQLELRKQHYKISAQLAELKRTNEVVQGQQQQMIEQAKMSALGVMACGVAHEINNPLSIIRTKAYLLNEKYGGSPENAYIGNVCAVITQTSDRIGKIVKSLQTLSQKEEHVLMQITPLAPLVEEAMSLSQIRSSMQGVTLRFNLAEFSDVEVNINPVQFSQVLLNLFNNAFDAIAELPEKWIQVKASTSDSAVEIRITDSGLGLTPEATSHLFEPFYSTKEVGAGTGLGLSLSRRLVEKQQGSLEYVPNEKHTTFRVVFPRPK